MKSTKEIRYKISDAIIISINAFYISKYLKRLENLINTEN